MSEMIIEGLLAVPEVVDLDGQRMDPVWLTVALREFMEAPRKVVLNFNPERPVGDVQSISRTDSGPVARVSVFEDECSRLIKSGAIRQLALGIRGCTVTSDVVTDGVIDRISLVDNATHEGDIEVVAPPL